MTISVQNVEATMGRGGSTDDFSVTEISVNSTSASQWIQPDGSVVMYVAKGELVEISVEIKRGGASLQGSNATVTVEMVHPIGFVMNTTSWSTTPLLGSQSFTDSFEWEAFVAHSYLDVSNNELSGGIIIRAHVFNPSDDRNENDMLEMELPVAQEMTWMQKEIQEIQHFLLLQSQHFTEESIRLTEAMLPELEFGKKIIRHPQ